MLFGYEDIVAFDLETTGFDPAFDEIIEIGAVRIRSDGSFERFSTLVSPSRPIPLHIRQLTGIDDEMVAGAPGLPEALDGFLGFVGDAALVAHNAPFDLSFIQRKSLDLGLKPPRNPTVDTLSLAKALFPNLVNHQLETVAALFGFEHRRAHRALPDAEATAHAAKGLWQKMLSLPDELFEQMLRLTFSAGMVDLGELFTRAQMFRMRGRPEPPAVDERVLLKLQNEFGEPTRARVEFSAELVTSYLSEGSPLAGVLPKFRPRPQQKQMSELVAQAFSGGELLMVEAGTGVGKSFAYLLPAVFWAAASGEKVVISTFTKALQEQLFFSDIPALAKVLPFGFKAILLKGKGNYICLNRLQRYIENPGLLSFREREGLLYIVSWLGETESGDITENTAFLNMRQNYFWDKVRADGHTCIGKKCKFFPTCFVHKVRRQVHDAQILVVNHALLLSDLQSGLLGDYKYLIVDEAHNLERVAVSHLGGTVALWRFRSTLDGIFSETPARSGTLALLFGALGEKEEYAQPFSKASNAVIAARAFAEQFFTELAELMEYIYHWREQRYPVRRRYDVDNPVFARLEPLGRTLLGYLERAKGALKAFADVVVPSDAQTDRLLEELCGQISKLDELAQDLSFVLSPTERDFVYWFESPPRVDSNEAKLCWAPLNIGEILHDELYSHLGAVVFTSATLTVAGSFEYFLENLGVAFAPPERINQKLLGSPYDFDRQLAIAIARFMPDPTPANERAFVEKASEVIYESSRRMRKGTLALFTSHSMLQQVFHNLYDQLRREGIRVMAQGLSGSHSALARQFVEDTESVLLGTETFWQGIDVPGESLEVLFLVKLPFGAPDDPYTEAKQELIRARGGDPFTEYIVPQAVIKFRQGVGRLIRSETDRGVLVIMDPRAASRRYGEFFVKSLPTKPVDVFDPQELFDIIAEKLG